MRNLLFTLWLIICNSCMPEKALEIDLSREIYTPEHYVIPKADGPVLIDGKASEPDWNNAPFSTLFTDIEGIKKPKYDTKMKMLWDEQYLYVFAYLEEPHIWGNLIQRDTVIFYNNDFEVFIDPSGDTYNYGEIEVNALNTIWDLKLDKPYRSGANVDNHWNLDKLKCAVNINGTLNNSADIDSFWTVEMAIPMDRIMELKEADSAYPRDGEQWRVNFSRVNWDHDLIDGRYDRKKEDDKYLPEYNWVWSKQGVIAMHEPEKWGFVQFSGRAVPNDSEFVKDPDLHIKLTAYALFRQVNGGSLKELSSKAEGYKEYIKAETGEEKNVEAVFVKTKDGFTIDVHHPEKDKVFSIDQKGWVEIK